MARSYRHAVAGLLRKRRELEGELHALQERAGAIGNDIAAINRSLACLGYMDGLGVLKAQCVRDGVSPRSHLRRALGAEMRKAGCPLTARQLAHKIAEIEGLSTSDSKFMTEMAKRIAKALRIMRERGMVTSGRDDQGQFVWQLISGALPAALPDPRHRMQQR